MLVGNIQTWEDSFVSDVIIVKMYIMTRMTLVQIVSVSITYHQVDIVINAKWIRMTDQPIWINDPQL